MIKKKILFIFILIFILEITAVIVKNPIFPRVSSLGNHIFNTLSIEWLRQFLFPSLQTLTAGYIIGTTFGLIIAILISEFEIVETSLLPIINFLRNIPSVAKIPILISIFGIEQKARISSIAVAVFFVMFLPTYYQLKETKSQYLEFQHIYKLNRLKSIVDLKLPLAISGVITGLRASIQISLIIMVVSEMLGSPIGLGAFLVHAQNLFDVYNLWMAIIILGLLGLLLNLLFDTSINRFFPWYIRNQGPNK